MSPKPYPAISRGPRGSFEWAMDQIRAGNEVRREEWPIEVWPIPIRSATPHFKTAIWHLYDVGGTTICKGFNSGVCGADNDSWGDLGMDSGVYIPSPDDMVALDWQLISEVTREQILERDANRVQRYPSEDVAEYLASIRPRPPWQIALACGLIVLGLALIFYAVGAKAAEGEACLLLRVGTGARAKMIPIATPFPSLVDCEKASASMVDGKTIRVGVCLPLHIFDCRREVPALDYPPPLPRPAPIHRFLPPAA